MTSTGQECSIIQAALTLITTWAEREYNDTRDSNDKIVSLQEAISGYEPALTRLLDMVEKNKSSIRARIKYI